MARHGRLPTLLARDWKDGTNPSPHGRHSESLPVVLNNNPRLPTLRATDGEDLGGTLNPDWCEWFMGWPIGWTASEPLETDRFRQWLLGHGRRYDDDDRDHK
jgi:hypothetical protein